jgi:hypothetical protein
MALSLAIHSLPGLPILSLRESSFFCDQCVVLMRDRIMANVNGCIPLGGNRAPSFILLDFVNVGEGFQVADSLNGFK